MNVQDTLQRVAIFVTKGSKASGWRAEQYFNDAGEQLSTYWAWRKKAGKHLPQADDQARQLGIELSEAWEKHEREEQQHRDVHQDHMSKRDANPLGNLPPKASRMWEHVYESAQERGLAKGDAAAQAWCAVKRQYHKKGNRWLKRKQPLGPKEQPPGCTPVRKGNTHEHDHGDACCSSCAVGKACEAKCVNPPSTRKLKTKLLR
jgi:hypothetical protein